MSNEQLYGMGAVAERTGLNAPSIRMWEKRYGAVVPQRTDTNRRLYRAEDVDRLVLMKRLTDHGHAISRIANLSIEQLRMRLSEIPPEDGVDANSQDTETAVRSRVGIVSGNLQEMLEDMDLFEAEVVGKATSLDSAVGELEFPHVDLLIVEAESLFLETIAKLREVVQMSESKLTLVVYRFASSKTVTALAKVIEGVHLLKAPVTDIQLRRECLVLLNTLRPGASRQEILQPGPVPERLYEADQLARLSRISSTVECECPQHMAELLKGLSAFEKYSRECEDRNAEDAVLHAFLHRTTAHVRRSMEEALRHLIHSEGIKLE
ncbi:MerR family transcriptional regulator [Haloferula sp.]|uniref:MerR family transcriptional regulator n=1 Tax=Haloferula sp. TaxID=2497595 RepID=UPI00329F580A